jgi:hypothetical protein
LDFAVERRGLKSSPFKQWLKVHPTNQLPGDNRLKKHKFSLPDLRLTGGGVVSLWLNLRGQVEKIPRCGNNFTKTGGGTV